MDRLARIRRLAARGVKVSVFDRGAAGAGATHAAAGMLAACAEAEPGEEALVALGRDSQARWPAFAAELLRATGIDVELRQEGTLVLAVTGLLALIQWQSFFPGRRDSISLAGLPIRPRQIFLARFATVLLFSGATPAISDRLLWLRHVVPLPILELSHLLGSAVGVGLMVLANGLYRRLDAAWAPLPQ